MAKSKFCHLSQATKAIGISYHSYRQARDIVRLADRTDLPAKDVELIRESLFNLNKTRRHEQIKSISQRVWGEKRTSEAKRREIFEDSISIIVQACSTGSQMEIPTANKLLQQCIHQRARL